MRNEPTNTSEQHTDLTLDGWVWTGWIKNPPAPECGKAYEELKARASQSDHGEERLVVERPDGSGADCYYRETTIKQ